MRRGFARLSELVGSARNVEVQGTSGLTYSGDLAQRFELLSGLVAALGHLLQEQPLRFGQAQNPVPEIIRNRTEIIRRGPQFDARGPVRVFHGSHGGLHPFFEAVQDGFPA